MSHLIDRILKRCETFRASLVDPVKWAQITKANLQEYSEGSVQDKKITNQLPAITAQIKQTQPVAIEEFDFIMRSEHIFEFQVMCIWRCCRRPEKGSGIWADLSLDIYERCH